ncbi:MAG: hypothetical protein P0Y49_09660 [Candidatus Pedobacter colombiensis]|uniref:Uncharacterized protein n=1 Tax=Candidatus Pedobacter colombiensis TaxID=3121371 RepID=A0AAJ5WDE4_9SPHI|nr:hypothetical protein [Pedobacter sp.]WEK21404.1 MAG: hypothetical protein P0Y49_09660 [Pedobacter sp.]
MGSIINSFTSNLSKVSLVQSSPQEMEVVDAYKEQIEQLIPDENFAAVLNENLEVMVENTIYKVTPYGTFMIEQPAYTGFIQRLNAIPYEEDQVLVDDPFYQNRISDNVYQIEEGVTLIDTYEASVNQIENVLQVQDYPVTYSATWQYRPDADAWIYDNLPTIKYGGKTWLGKLFESIFGREEIHTENFESKRRVRVNFYNMSWGVYSSIGVSVKMQKKNWIGWSGTNASELRMGWDAMEYYIGSLPSAPSAPISTTPQRFTKLDLPKVTKDYVEVDLLGYPFTFDRNEALQKGIKKIHEMLPTVSGLKPKSERTVNYAYKVWADFGKRSISIVQDRDEIIGYNTESLSKVFDWSIGVKASWGFDGPPTLGYAPLKFTISRASVFGIAKYNNVWKGARIIVGD